MTAHQPAGDAFDQALTSVEPDVQEALRAIVADSAYVEPRVVSHLRD